MGSSAPTPSPEIPQLPSLWDSSVPLTPDLLVFSAAMSGYQVMSGTKHVMLEYQVMLGYQVTSGYQAHDVGGPTVSGYQVMLRYQVCDVGVPSM